MPVNRKLIANPPPWPNGARCAVAFTFDMDADSILHLAHHKNANNLVMAMSQLQYGPRVAMPRIVTGQLASFRLGPGQSPPGASGRPPLRDASTGWAG